MTALFRFWASHASELGALFAQHVLLVLGSTAIAIVIGVPLGIAFFILLLTLAVAGETEWYVIVGVGTIMGVLGAVLFGMLGGVTLVAHVLEDVDRGTPTH